VRIFTPIYDKMLVWSKHPKAPFYLGSVSFMESSFFPIPPDVMLMPMCLSQPDKAYRFALLTTITSVLGGIFGYMIGYWMLDLIWPLIEGVNYDSTYHQVVEVFALYGFWIVFLAGFSPLPYKLFTIAAGATAMALFPFIIASIIGRASRFYLVAAVMKIGGKRYEDKIRKSVDWIGYSMLLIAAAFIIFRYVL